MGTAIYPAAATNQKHLIEKSTTARLKRLLNKQRPQQQQTEATEPEDR